MWHCSPRGISGIIQSLIALAMVLSVSCSLEHPLKLIPLREVQKEGGGLQISMRSGDGSISRIVSRSDIGPTGIDGDSLALESLFLEIGDGLTGRTIDSRIDTSRMVSFEETPEGVLLEKRFSGSPFHLRQSLSVGQEGVKINTRLNTQEDTVRSVTVTYVLPLPRGCNFWSATGENPVKLEAGVSREYVCGPSGSGVSRTALPLAVLWSGDGIGIALAAPLETPNVRVTFSLEFESYPLGLAKAGSEAGQLRVCFDLIGLRPGRELETGLWLYGFKGDWRSALAMFAERYREYFEPRTGASRRDGIIGLIDPLDERGNGYAALRQQDVSIAEIAWNWRRPGEWLMPQALRFDDFTWNCEAFPARWEQISVQTVRTSLDALALSELRSVLQGTFSQWCDQELAQGRFQEDIARDESGELITSPAGYVLMRSTPESPYGRNMLEQQKSMMDLFSQASGYYFDNWEVTGLDFAHDDSLTTVNNRPAWYLGRNLDGTGSALVEMAREGRKLILANAPVNVALSRGIDVVTVDPSQPGAIPAAAFLGLWRPVQAHQRPDGALHGPEGLEETLLQQLLWGVLPSQGQLEADPALGRVYRPLFQALRGRQWVLDPRAVETSAEVSAQIYRVPALDRSGELDLLISVVRPGVRISDVGQRRGVILRVRAAEARTVTRAVWQAAGVSWNVQLKGVLEEDEETLALEIPPFGPAGVLRLSQK